jgi:hypothetical protein
MVMSGATTTAVHDQIMRHNPNSDIFNAYLNEKVRFDVQSAFLERPSTDGLTRAFTHMSLTTDPQAPTDVPQEIMDALPPNPDVLAMEVERAQLFKELREEYRFVRRAPETDIRKKTHQQLVGKIVNKNKKLHEEAKKQYRRDYFYRIHNKAMERHLNNIATDEYIELVIEHQLQERTQLQEVICDFSEDLTTKDIVKRRIRAIDLMVALCCQREDQRPKLRSIIIHPEPVKEESPGPELSDLEPFPMLCKKTQCPICIGDERMTYERRTFSYSRPSKLMDHVESAHLRKIPEHQAISCRHPVCVSSGLVLNNLMHFKNHVQRIHGISLRA